MFKLGKMIALSKPDGGVRGIVTGDVVLRWSGLIAFSTKVRCEFIAHTLQGLTDVVDPVDGVSAFDLVSRGATMHGRIKWMEEERQFHSSKCLWLCVGVFVKKLPRCRAHHPTGRGSEQRSALLLLFSVVGQHQAPETVKGQLSDGTICSCISMTRSSSPNRKNTEICPKVWKPSCGIEPRFELVGARQKYGIGQASDPQFATNSRREPEPLIGQRSQVPSAMSEGCWHSIGSS